MITVIDIYGRTITGELLGISNNFANVIKYHLGLANGRTAWVAVPK